jgi:hypothetical protein
MKFQNILRTQAVLIGLGATLLLAGATRGQEIENTSFDDGPNVTTVSQPAPSVSALVSLPATAQSTETIAPVAPQQAALSVVSPVEGGLMAFLILCIALLATYVVTEIRAISHLRQARHNLNARIKAHVDRRVALS